MVKPKESLSAIKSKLISTLKIDTTNHPNDYNILKSTNQSGYTQQLIEYKGYEGDIIKAYLLIPNGEGSFPAVVVHHQHNSQFHLGKSEVCGLAGDPLNAFAPTLAQKGFIVLAPDSIGFEDRRRNQTGIEENKEKDWLQYFNGMAYRMVKGKLLITAVINEALIATNILANHPKVNANTIGVIGHSYGGNTTLFQAAIDDRIKFACASGAACSYKNKIENETGLEMALIIPDVLNTFDIEDVVASSSSKHLLLLAATEDKYSKNAKEITLNAQKQLSTLNEENNIALKEFEGAHPLTQERFDYIIDWIVGKASLLR